MRNRADRRTAGRRTVDRRTADRRTAVAMLAPLFVFLLTVAIFPTLYAWWVSFTDLRIGKAGTGSFAGLTNFRHVFDDELTRNSLVKTGLFLAIGLPVQLVLGFLLAKLFVAVDGVRGMRLLRTLYLMPVMVTPLLVGLMWEYLLDPLSGVVDAVLGFAGMPQPDWLSSPDYTLWVVLGLEVWQWLPLATMILFAGLLSLPPDVREAARVDGAGPVRTALLIEIPMLVRIIGVVGILEAVQLIGSFSLVLAATQGGPGSTTIVSSFAIYRQAFVYFNTGQAAAAAIIVLLFTILLSQVFARVALKDRQAG